jgi:hypothetical protein
MCCPLVGATVVTNAVLRAAREEGLAMKRFANDGRNEQQGRRLIPAPRSAQEVPLGLSFEGGGVVGAGRYSRRQAIGLLGGSLVGLSLLSLGLAAPAEAVNPFGIRGPSGYSIPQLRAVRGGNWFNLTPWWRCVFQPSVVNHTFQTNWVLYEEDNPPINDDDLMSATVEPHPHSAYSPKKVFVPSQANPSNPQEVSFKETIGWHRDDLNTEIGDEELFAYVRLGDDTTHSGLYAVESSLLTLSP